MASLDLSDRAYLVTGPAKGMGAAISLAIAQAGGDLVLAGRDMPPIEALAEEARALGRTVVVHQTDVTRESDVEVAVAVGRMAFADRLQGAVLVAGLPGPSGKKLWEHNVEDFHALFDVNVLGVFLVMKHLLPAMMAAGAGSLVTIGGTYGFKGVRDASLYGATKWTLRGLTKSAALESGRQGVRVNMVSPGAVEGERLTRQFGEQAAREGTDYATVFDRFVAGTALGRASLDSDVADAVLFLLSDASRNITGQDLLVDGGTIV
jgi:NAD(P)-dependent dehydrogenase (short-subunit alcohol dehydrogenase family)